MNPTPGIAPPALVIFDCDGVLVDTERICDEVVSSLLQEIGLTMTPEDVARRATGLADSDMWAMFEAELGSPLPPDIMARELELELERFKDQLQPMAGVAGVINRLVEEGIPICVASSGTPERMDVTLGVTGLAGCFEGRIFSASQVARGKPAPDVFLLAASRMGVAPERCTVIEDSRPGVEGALAARMTVLGYCPNGDVWGLEELGIRTFREMNALPALILPP